MPEKILLITSSFWEGADLWTLARVVGADNTTLVQSNLDGSPPWRLDVFDLSSSTPTTAIYTQTGVAASEIMFNTLQLDGYWSVDNIGYNMRHRLPNANIPSANSAGGRKLGLEFSLITSLWGLVPVVHEAHQRALNRL